jgi:hypothetical protein
MDTISRDGWWHHLLLEMLAPKNIFLGIVGGSVIPLLCRSGLPLELSLEKTKHYCRSFFSSGSPVSLYIHSKIRKSIQVYLNIQLTRKLFE